MMRSINYREVHIVLPMTAQLQENPCNFFDSAHFPQVQRIKI
jgi:hypothetical protein